MIKFVDLLVACIFSICYVSCAVKGEVGAEYIFPSNELCVACTALSTPFFTEIYYANETQLLNYAEQTCNLIDNSLLNKLCFETLSHIIETLEDDAESFLADYTPYSWCATASLCPSPCCVSNSPEQQHISVTGSYSQMAITWIQSTNTSEPYVRYHEVDQPDHIQINSNVTVETYHAGGWIGFIYKCVLTDLKSSTQYNYTVGSNAALSSPGYLFTSPPSPSDPQFNNVKFAIYGDMGDTTSSQQVMSVLKEYIHFDNIDLVLHVGDITYAGGYQKIWDDWMRQMTPIFANTPYMAVEGNHESEHHFAAYNHRFRNPGLESGSNTTKYFSYNYGNIHFLAFTFEDFLDIDNDPLFGSQHEWIKNDLHRANQNRDQQPWIVCYAHRPLYCTYLDHSRCVDEATRYRRQLEKLFYDNKVDLVVAGHNHNYERTYPVYNLNVQSLNYTNPLAPVYSVVGSGGRSLDFGFYEPAPEWSVASSRSANWGFAVVTSQNNSQLSFQWIEAYSNAVIDSFAIIKTN